MDVASIVSLILTGALVVATCIYAWLTYLIAGRTKQSADAALSAAQASERAAEASQRMAALAEASLQVSFDVSPDRHNDGEVWMTVRVHGANIWLHGARVLWGIVMEDPDTPTQEVAPVELRVINGAEDYPRFIPAGSGGISLIWPGAQYRLSDWGVGGLVSLDFSLTPNGERSTREQVFESPEGFHHTLNQKRGTFPDLLRVNEARESKGEKEDGPTS